MNELEHDLHHAEKMLDLATGRMNDAYFLLELAVEALYKARKAHENATQNTPVSVRSEGTTSA